MCCDDDILLPIRWVCILLFARQIYHRRKSQEPILNFFRCYIFLLACAFRDWRFDYLLLLFSDELRLYYHSLHCNLDHHASAATRQICRFLVLLQKSESVFKHRVYLLPMGGPYPDSRDHIRIYILQLILLHIDLHRWLQYISYELGNIRSNMPNMYFSYWFCSYLSLSELWIQWNWTYEKKIHTIISLSIHYALCSCCVNLRDFEPERRCCYYLDSQCNVYIWNSLSITL